MTKSERLRILLGERYKEASIHKSDAEKYLRRVRNLIRKGWIKGSPAEDSDGNLTSAFAANSVRFCLIGAMSRASNDMGLDVDAVLLGRRAIQSIVLPDDVRRGTASTSVDYGLAKWNDQTTTTKSMVDLVLAEAITTVMEL